MICYMPIECYFLFPHTLVFAFLPGATEFQAFLGHIDLVARSLRRYVGDGRRAEKDTK